MALPQDQKNPPKTLRSDLEEIERRRKAIINQLVQSQTPSKDFEVEPISANPYEFGKGYAANALDNGWRMLKTIFRDLPVAAVTTVHKAGQDVVNLARGYDPAEYEFNYLKTGPEVMQGEDPVRQAIRLSDSLAKGLIEPWQKHGLKNFYYNPIDSVLDVSVIGGLLGKSVAIASKVTGSVKGLEAAEGIQKFLEHPIRPLTDKIAKQVGVDLPARREFKQMLRTEEAHKLVDVMEKDALVSRPVAKLSDDEAALLYKWTVNGATSEEAATNPMIANLVKKWTSVAEDIQEEAKARGILTDAQVRGALEKKIAVDMPGGVTKENIDLARLRIDSLNPAAGDIRPIWHRAYHDSATAKSVGDYIDEFLDLSGERKIGAVGMLEKFKGAQGATKDPRVFIPRAIREWANAEHKLRLVERTIQHPEWTKVAASGEYPLRDLMPSRGVLAKYFDQESQAYKLRAQGKAVTQAAKEAGGFEKLGGSITGADPAVRQQVAEAANIFIENPTIRLMLKREFVRSDNGLLKLYDTLTRVFTTSATKWNPRWYTGNVVGDALLSALGGGSWTRAKKLIDAGAGPIEARARVGMAAGTAGMGKYIESGAELVNDVDELSRTSIIEKQVAMRLERAGIAWEDSASQMAAVMKSTENFSEVQVRMQLYAEKIAGGSRTIQRLDSRLKGLAEKEVSLREDVARNLKSKGRGVQALLKRAEKAKGIEKEIQVVQQRVANLDEMRRKVVADIKDNAVVSGAMEKWIPGLKRQMDILNPAIDAGNAFFGEYLGMPALEKAVMRRAFPFWSWTKSMMMLAFRLPFMNPTRTFLWNRLGATMLSLVNDEELPEGMKGLIPIFALKDGSMLWQKFSSWMPAGGVRPSKLGDVSIPSGIDPTSNPWVHLGFRLKGGETVFETGSAIPFGENVVNIYNGEAYEFRNGRLSKTIDQPPFLSTVAQMFPTAQFAEDMITPFLGYRTVGGEKGSFPRPTLNPDGSYRYPAEWWESLGTLAGISTVRRSKESFVESEQKRVTAAFQGLIKAYRNAPPERREGIERMLRDYYKAGKIRLGD